MFYDEVTGLLAVTFGRLIFFRLGVFITYVDVPARSGFLIDIPERVMSLTQTAANCSP